MNAPRVVTTVVALCVLGALPVSGQTLAERVRAVESGSVTFRFATRPEVQTCEGWSGTSWGTRGGTDRDDGTCWNGPAEVEVRVRDGEVRSLDVDLVRPGRTAPSGAGWLGSVPARDAADFLLTLAATARESVAEDALGAAAMVDEVTVWPDFLRIARDADRPADVRKSATFWIGQASADEALDGLVQIIEDDPDSEVREAAVFALTQRDDLEAVPILMELAQADGDPGVRRSAFFWLAQYEDPRVLDFFERVLTGG